MSEDIASPEPDTLRHWGFAFGGPDVLSFLPTIGGRWVAGGLQVGCSRGRVGDSCSRSIPAPAQAPLPPPGRAAPSNPHRFWVAPPAALSANTAFVCAGARGLGVCGGQGLCVREFASCPTPPAAGPPRVRSSRDTGQREFLLPPKYSGVGGRGQAWQTRRTGLRVFDLHYSFGASVPPSVKKHAMTGRERIPGRPRSACSPSVPSGCFCFF